MRNIAHHQNKVLVTDILNLLIFDIIIAGRGSSATTSDCNMCDEHIHSPSSAQPDFITFSLPKVSYLKFSY